jgi:hypothetical protein
MGILKNGLNGHFHGKIDGLVCFTRLDKNVTRTQAKSKGDYSPRQLANMQRMKVTSEFLTPVLEFVNLGFKPEGLKRKKTAYNCATSEVKLNGLKGIYPDVSLDFETLMLSKGRLGIAEGVTFSMVPTGIEFKWAVDPKEQWPDSTDQVMLLAYFPSTKTTRYVLYGTERSSGMAILPISTPMHGVEMHLYISFISANRNDVSNSVYAGPLNL